MIKYRKTHIVLAKWHTGSDMWRKSDEMVLKNITGFAPVDLICFAADSTGTFIDDAGRIAIDFDALD